MLDLFKAQLKAKSIAAGAPAISNAKLEAMASKFHAKFPDLTDPAEHDAKIDDVYDAEMFKEIQSLDHFTKAKAERESGKKKENEKKEQDANDGPKSELDELKELVKGLATTVQTMTAEKQTQSMQQKLAANEKLKAIDAKLYAKWQLPKTDEEIEAFADEVVGTYGHLAAPKEEAFIPGQQRQQAVGSTKIDPAIKAFVDKNATATQK